jgi:hypothetical protein
MAFWQQLGVISIHPPPENSTQLILDAERTNLS